MEVDLNRYCDLTANQVTFLRDPARAHPAARAAFIKDGLLFPDGVTLTPDGRKALEIAEAYLSGQRKPEPPIVIIQDGVEIRFAPDRQRGWRGDTSAPYTGWKQFGISGKRTTSWGAP
jgi:hypothetical protein